MARVVFLGTPRPAASILRALLDAGHDVPLVITRPDKRRGRGGELSPSPVKQVATEAGIAVTDDLNDVAGTDAELGVVVAYGRIIPREIIDALPMVNVHFSLLPRWRGAAPVERAILAGDDTTGVCLMQLVEELDAGPVYACSETAIDSNVTSGELVARLTGMGADLLVSGLRSGLGEPTEQVGEATYAAKITLEDLHLDWARPADELVRVVRLERAWTTLEGARLKVLKAEVVAAAGGPVGELSGDVVRAAGATGLRLLTVQPEGKAPMDAQSWLRGARLAEHTVLGT